MKPASVLLGVSLVANVALAFTAIFRAEVRARLAAERPVDSRLARDAAPRSTEPEIDPGTWQRLSSGDLAAVVARLKSEGLPSRLLRLLVEHLVSEQFTERRRAIAAQEPPEAWWQRPFYVSAFNPQSAALRRQLAREERDLVAQLTGPLPIDELEHARRVRQYGSLAPEKVARFEQIERDYRDLMEDVRAQARDMILPEDREKLAFLESEKRADLAKLLSAEEWFEYEVRSSVTARRLREQLMLFEPTEAEFRAMFALQNATESKFGGGRLQNLTAAERRERNEALRQLPVQMQTVLTPERYAAYQLAIDPAYRQAHQFVTEQALPPAAAREMVDLQKDAAARANAIRSDRGLTVDQRNAELARLAAEATSKLTTTLGERGLAAYREGAGAWLNMLQPPSPPAPPSTPQP
jgi:hypothetical protein